MLSLTTAAISFSSLSAPLRPAVSFGRIGTVVAQNEMEPGEGWNVDNLTGMMDDAVQASGDAQVAAVAAVPTFDVKTMPGITAPLGFFDPLNFCGEASEGKIRFYREVEVRLRLPNAGIISVTCMPHVVCSRLGALLFFSSAYSAARSAAALTD